LETSFETFRAKVGNDTDFDHFAAYAAAVYSNCGNYQSFGDFKFVPELSPKSFRRLLDVSVAYSQFPSVIDNLWEELRDLIFTEDPPLGKLAFRDDNGTTTFYSNTVTKLDAQLVGDFLQSQSISPINTRVLKRGPNDFLARVGSIESSKQVTPYLGSY
jgi:dipeptidyl-peptidase III